MNLNLTKMRKALAKRGKELKKLYDANGWGYAWLAGNRVVTNSKKGK
jgi:hypothetical protein